MKSWFSRSITFISALLKNFVSSWFLIVLRTAPALVRQAGFGPQNIQLGFGVPYLDGKELPAVSVWISHPYLVLKGVATIGVHFIERREAGLLQPLFGAEDVLGCRHLNSEMAERARAGDGAAVVEGQVQGGLGDVELGVARFVFHGLESEHRAVKPDGRLDVVDVKRHVYFEFGVHRFSLLMR